MKTDTKNRSIRRLKIIAGQLRGLETMIRDEKYCIDIITQTAAIKMALSSLEDLILEHHLSTHVVSQMKHGAEKKAINEILKVYQTQKKK